MVQKKSVAALTVEDDSMYPGFITIEMVFHGVIFVTIFVRFSLNVRTCRNTATQHIFRVATNMRITTKYGCI